MDAREADRRRGSRPQGAAVVRIAPKTSQKVVTYAFWTADRGWPQLEVEFKLRTGDPGYQASVHVRKVSPPRAGSDQTMQALDDLLSIETGGVAGIRDTRYDDEREKTTRHGDLVIRGVRDTVTLSERQMVCVAGELTVEVLQGAMGRFPGLFAWARRRSSTIKFRLPCDVSPHVLVQTTAEFGRWAADAVMIDAPDGSAETDADGSGEQ